MTYHTVGHGGRQQALDGTENGDSERRRHQTLHRLPRQCGHLRLGQCTVDGEAVADGLDTRHTGIVLEQQGHDGHEDDGYQRPGNLLAETGCHRNDHHTDDTDERRPPVKRGEIVGVGNPFLHKIGGHLRHRQTKEVLHLGSEDGDGDTAGKAHNDGIRDVLDDGAEPEHTKQHQKHARHDGGNGQSLHAILLDDAVDDDDKRTSGATDLHAATAKDGNDKTGHNGRDDALLGRYA